MFFFKQKTAYEMRISDWSSDVCSSDLDAEGAGFDAVRARTEAEWRKALGALEIEAPAPMRTNLYTALYHSLLAPSVWSDVDGRYRGPDDAVHAAKDFTFRRSEEHTSELQSLMRISYAVFCLKKKNNTKNHHQTYLTTSVNIQTKHS